jgi:hypothetical protein
LEATYFLDQVIRLPALIFDTSMCTYTLCIHDSYIRTCTNTYVHEHIFMCMHVHSTYVYGHIHATVLTVAILSGQVIYIITFHAYITHIARVAWRGSRKRKILGVHTFRTYNAPHIKLRPSLARLEKEEDI